LENTELLTILSSPKRIVITTHKNPDGDAMGSSLALYQYLTLKGHNALVITPNEYPDFLDWLPGNSTVKNAKDIPQFAKDRIAEAEIIFCLDFNTLNRIDQLAEPVEQSTAYKVLIDHHQQPQPFDFMFHRVEASSTCQLIFEFIDMLGDKAMINKDIASCLYTGIMTDTGSFKFPSTTATVHRIIADLIEAGAENSAIHRNVFSAYTANRLKLLGHCIGEKLTVIPEKATAYITLGKEELKKYSFQPGDTEGIVNYPLDIKGIKLSVIFIEREDGIKISFRSVGKFSVNQFSRANFGGGGHDNAAGGQSSLTLQQTVEKFVTLLDTYANEIINS
jgi:phosphoesterase RecJ-like protein